MLTAGQFGKTEQDKNNGKKSIAFSLSSVFEELGRAMMDKTQVHAKDLRLI